MLWMFILVLSTRRYATSGNAGCTSSWSKCAASNVCRGLSSLLFNIPKLLLRRLELLPPTALSPPTRLSRSPPLPYLQSVVIH